MIRHYSYSRGFTAVELIVAVVVGVLLLASGYQLYTTTLRNAGEAQMRSRASSAAYEILRDNIDNAVAPCVTSTTSATVPSYANLSNASASVVVTCPYGTSSNSSVITVTVTYSDPNVRQVSRALSTHPQ